MTAATQDRAVADECPGWTTKRLSNATGVPQPTLQRKIVLGAIKAYRVGSTYLVPREEIQRLFPDVKM